jgi:hypothetical protein
MRPNHCRISFSLPASSIAADGLYSRAALFLDRILKGAQAGSLPIEESVTLVLGINFGIAKALNLACPGNIAAEGSG